MKTTKPPRFKPNYSAEVSFADKELLRRGRELGLNVSLYLLLPENKRDAAFKADIKREEQMRLSVSKSEE